MTEQFEYGLKQLDMLDDVAPDATGLVFTDDIADGLFYERITAEKAKVYGAEGVYFKRFQNGRAPVPQIYIFDFTREEMNDDEIAELHRRLWNAGQVPLFFIFTKTEVKIFNCFKAPVFDAERNKFTTSQMAIVKLAAAIEDELNEKKRKEFSARQFDNGAFWDTSKYKDKFKLDDSSYESLLNYLKKVHCDIKSRNILDESIVQRLLVVSILVKYLEERVDKDGNTVFPEGFFSRFSEGAACFTDVLKVEGACLKLFDYLGTHFNGEIFKWEDERERELLARTDLTQFAGFLEARTDIDGQGTLWSIYSFNDLPIELISNIYEEFLGKEKDKGVVYTPPYLVHFLVDEVMPLESPVKDFKVLDPSCGSGVFLVAAYQRIIDWWRIQNGWKKPGTAVLKKLLTNSVFGIDVSPEAVRLTIFSLSLVLLDASSPKEIWENLKFDNLKKTGNQFDKDFFELIRSGQLKHTFDLVIGNPPFVEKLTSSAAIDVEKERQDHRDKIWNNQLALLFLEQSLALCKPGGLSALLQPSEAFLYNYGSVKFRKYFLQSCNVKEILDFTPLRESLFGSANAACVAVLAKNEPPEAKPILHAVFRRTKVSQEKIYLELDHYDLHFVSYNDALNNRMIWKANFLGGGRLGNLIARLGEYRTFGSFLEEKVESHGWLVAEHSRIGEEIAAKIRRLRAKCSELTEEEMVELERLEEMKKVDYRTENYRSIPIILTKANFSTLWYLAEHILRHAIPEADQIVWIYVPKNQSDESKEMVQRIKNNRVGKFLFGVFSGIQMFGREIAVNMEEFGNIPYPEELAELELSEIEKTLIDDVLDYMLDFRENGGGAEILESVDSSQLEDFSYLYCKILNTVYGKFRVHEPVVMDRFVCLPVCYGTSPQVEVDDSEQFEEYLQRLLYKEMGRNLRTVRVMRIYHDNMIYLIKPRQLRYWIKSIAVRDADETFEDLVKQGY